MITSGSACNFSNQDITNLCDIIRGTSAYLMIGLLDFGKVISLTGFRSHVLHNLSVSVDQTEKEVENEI